jgi:phage terminase small subunit
MRRAATTSTKGKAKPPAKKPTKKPAQDKREIFIRQYRIHRNASRAYREAGYNAGTAIHQNAHELLRSRYVADRIAEMDAEDLAKLDVKAFDVTRRLTNIAFADIARITEYHIGACRYCWGIEHRYQWRTPREFSEAVEQHMLKGEAYQANHPAPDNEGGYGYLAKKDPNPDCPECEGDGIQQVRFKDTRDFTPAERAVFAGVEQTQHGIKYRLNSQPDALLTIAKSLKMFKDEVEVGITDPLAVLLQQILDRAQTMPLAAVPQKKGAGT